LIVPVAAAIAIFTIGCEPEDLLRDPTDDLAGGNLVGTWGLIESAIKAAGMPHWAALVGDEDWAEARELSGRIAFYDDNTCYGELIHRGRAQNFEGTWIATGANLVMDFGTEMVAGRYGIDRGDLVFITTRDEEDMDVDVTFRLAPATEPLEKPVVEVDMYVDGDSEGHSDSGPRSADGSQTFLWKPESENDGKAVTLFPAQYRWDERGAKYEIDSVHISGGERDGAEPRVIYWPSGRNGNRVHARWSADGEDFGEDFDVVLVLKSGKEVSWHVDDGSDRTTE